MNAEEFLQELEVPDRTISGRKPKGQTTAYRCSLIELLESYHKAKFNNVDLANVRLSLPNDEEIDSYADEWEEKNNTKEYPIECRDLDEVAYILGVGARWVCSRVNGNKA